MNNRASGLLYVMAVLGYCLGVAAIISLIFIPIGIYAICGANYYISCTKLTDSELYTQKQRLTNWAIFFSICLFPIGLLSAIIAFLAGDNKVSVSGQDQAQESCRGQNDDVCKNSFKQTPSEAEQKIISEYEMEKFEQLKSYKEQGLITDAEFERAKKELFDK